MTKNLFFTEVKNDLLKNFYCNSLYTELFWSWKFSIQIATEPLMWMTIVYTIHITLATLLVQWESHDLDFFFLGAIVRFAFRLNNNQLTCGKNKKYALHIECKLWFIRFFSFRMSKMSINGIIYGWWLHIYIRYK